MDDGEARRLVTGLEARRVVVVSDRYPPDVAGGAEVSLHLMMREAPLRDRAVVVTFDKSLRGPARRSLDGVEILALPANAAWPLHRLSQQDVESLKRRRFGLKWLAFWREALEGLARSPRAHGPALALRLLGAPRGGVRMEHVVAPEGRATADLRSILAALEPALVHADNAGAIMTAAEALAGNATPLVAVVRDHRFTSARFDQTHGAQDAGPRGKLAALSAERALAHRRRLLGRATIVAATSAHLAATLEGVVPRERLRRAALVPSELPPLAERGDRPFTILIAGSLNANKGQARLLEAWPEIVGRIPDARIEIAGEGPARAEIERLIAGFGAGGRIRLHGRVPADALWRLYRDCDVVALPTLWAEPFGRGPIEAGAAGRPVVAYASGGLVETVADGVTGRLAPCGDREAFVAALAELAADPEARAAMGRAGRARVAEANDPARLARGLAELWDEAAGSGASPVARRDVA